METVGSRFGELPRGLPRIDLPELMAQGVANVVTPFFGGIPATGTEPPAPRAS